MNPYFTSTYALFLVTTTLLLSSPYSFSFGTLMTSPEERVELDKIRNGLISPSVRHVEHSSVRATKVLELNGLVKRRSGPNTIWVNGAVVQKPAIAGVSIDADKVVDSAVVFKLSPVTKPLLLKPGQRLGIEEGNVAESYNSNTLINLDRNSQSSEESGYISLPVSNME